VWFVCGPFGEPVRGVHAKGKLKKVHSNRDLI
jgi:hypothetical protein